VDIVGKSVAASSDYKRQCTCEATVMIVDDNPFNLMPLRMLLKQYKIKVIEA